MAGETQGSMGHKENNRTADAARGWLENLIQQKPAKHEALWGGAFYASLSVSGLQISHINGGRALCSFRVPAHLTDEDGNWQAGAIAAMIDNVGAAAIMTTEGVIKVSVEFDISFFSTAKVNEEVEIDARIVEHRGRKLTAVTVEIRKKGGGHLVAIGRQWMTSGRPISSKFSRSASTYSSKL